MNLAASTDFGAGACWKLRFSPPERLLRRPHPRSCRPNGIPCEQSCFPRWQQEHQSATDTFLRINGLYLELQTIAAHKFITESITKREFRISQIRQWLAAHGAPAQRRLIKFNAELVMSHHHKSSSLSDPSDATSADIFLRTDVRCAPRGCRNA